MTSDIRDPDYYLDWACRVTEEACAKTNLSLSEDGREALRNLWKDAARPLARQPAQFRAGSAAMRYWLSEAAHFMLKSAEYAGADSIGPAEVKSGTEALMKAREHAQISCLWCVPPKDPVESQRAT